MLLSNGETLSAFGNIIKEIVDDEIVTEAAMLCAGSFSLRHNINGIITNAHRQNKDIA